MNLERLIVAFALGAVGVVLVVFFGSTEFIWFRGQPLGIVLLIIAAIDAADAVLRRRN